LRTYNVEVVDAIAVVGATFVVVVIMPPVIGDVVVMPVVDVALGIVAVPDVVVAGTLVAVVVIAGRVVCVTTGVVAIKTGVVVVGHVDGIAGRNAFTTQLKQLVNLGKPSEEGRTSKLDTEKG
jgi:hypothetical protein